MRVLVAIVLAGCTYTPPTAPGTPNDGAGGDASIDGTVTTDTPPPTGCIAKWSDGTVGLSPPAEVPNISFGTTDRDPWLNKDESFIYFSRPGNGGDTDVQFSQRALSGFFNSPTEKGSLSDNSGQDEKVAMTEDELTAIVASDRTGQGFDLLEAKRATAGLTAFSSASGVNLTAINTSGDESDPHLSGDGLRLYYAAGSPQKIFAAERVALPAPFAAGSEIGNIGDPAGDADPTLSGDELVLVFTSNRTGLGGTDLWYSTRPARGQPFSQPVAVPTVNTSNNDGDAHLSPDGCNLYFSSDRAGTFDIYLAVVQ